MFASARRWLLDRSICQAFFLRRCRSMPVRPVPRNAAVQGPASEATLRRSVDLTKPTFESHAIAGEAPGGGASPESQDRWLAIRLWRRWILP